MNITLEGEVASRQPDSIPKRKTRNEKRLRNAAIAFSHRHYIAAYLAGRVHRAVPDRRSRTLLSDYTNDESMRWRAAGPACDHLDSVCKGLLSTKRDDRWRRCQN